jgi:peptide-methionine (R)-S-oxide reductase
MFRRFLTLLSCAKRDATTRVADSSVCTLAASFLIPFVSGTVVLASALWLWPTPQVTSAASPASSALVSHAAVAKPHLKLSDDQWRTLLTDKQFQILRRADTERPFDNRYFDFKGHGTFACVACGSRLFSSAAKYDSGTGWPTFSKPLDNEVVAERADNSHGMRRTEVVCSRCGGHLGHVFDDGPPPTGLRYCMNSGALTFFGDKHAVEHAE